MHMLIHCLGNNSIYATVISANRPALWSCHERFADKQVTPKARHNSDGEEPYEKRKVVPNYPDNYEIIYLTSVGFITTRASHSQRICVAHTSNSNRKTSNERADMSQVQYENETTKQLTGNAMVASYNH